MAGLEGLSINLATVREQFDLPQAVAACRKLGISAIAPWRDQVAKCGLQEAARIMQDNGIRLVNAMTVAMLLSGVLSITMIWLGPETRGRQFTAEDIPSA